MDGYKFIVFACAFSLVHCFDTWLHLRQMWTLGTFDILYVWQKHFSGLLRSDSFPCHLPCTPDLVAILRPALSGRRMSLWVWVGAWPCWDANLSAPCKPQQRGPHLSPPPTCSSSGVARGRLTGLMRTTWTGLACVQQREREKCGLSLWDLARPTRHIPSHNAALSTATPNP